MIKYYFSVLGNFSFRGRARRSEYWWFLVFNAIVGRAIEFVGELMHWEISIPDDPERISIAGTIYGFATLIQSLAVAARRFHDRGISAWFLLPLMVAVVVVATINPMLILIVGVVISVIAALPGAEGENKYGPDPKAEEV